MAPEPFPWGKVWGWKAAGLLILTLWRLRLVCVFVLVFNKRFKK